MWYSMIQAKTTLYPFPDPRRATGARSGVTLCQQLYLAPLPNPARQLSWAAGPTNCRAARMRRSNRAQRHSCLQYGWAGGHPAQLISTASRPPRRLRRHPPRTVTRSAPPPSKDLRQTDQSLDLVPGRRGRLCRGDHAPIGQRRGHSARATAARGQLATRQTLDYQPRPSLCPKKNSATA